MCDTDIDVHGENIKKIYISYLNFNLIFYNDVIFVWFSCYNRKQIELYIYY